MFRRQIAHHSLKNIKFINYPQFELVCFKLNNWILFCGLGGRTQVSFGVSATPDTSLVSGVPTKKKCLVTHRFLIFDRCVLSKLAAYKNLINASKPVWISSSSPFCLSGTKAVFIYEEKNTSLVLVSCPFCL